MKAQPEWLDRVDVDAMHDELIAEHGGAHGVRDEGLLLSALARPRDRLAYDESADLCAIAAAYAFGLAKNHAYVDGNKRIAFMAMWSFLRINGVVIEAGEPEVVTLIVGVADGGVPEASIAGWLRSHTKRV